MFSRSTFSFKVKAACSDFVWFTLMVVFSSLQYHTWSSSRTKASFPTQNQVARETAHRKGNIVGNKRSFDGKYKEIRNHVLYGKQKGISFY